MKSFKEFLAELKKYTRKDVYRVFSDSSYVDKTTNVEKEYGEDIDAALIAINKGDWDTFYAIVGAESTKEQKQVKAILDGKVGISESTKIDKVKERKMFNNFESFVWKVDGKPFDITEYSLNFENATSSDGGTDYRVPVIELTLNGDFKKNKTELKVLISTIERKFNVILIHTKSGLHNGSDSYYDLYFIGKDGK